MPRNVFYVVLLLQLVSTIERQIFDFLGYMWVPILGNFFNIIFVIFGLFGLYQYRSHYMLAYAAWSLFWIGFNIFMVCFYLEIGNLSNKDDILSFGTGSFSWWVVNSPGCQPHYNTTISEDFNPLHPLRPSYLEGCILTYSDVEVTHATIQLVISTAGLLLGIYMSHYLITVVNRKKEKQGVKAMYSIEYSPHRAGQDSVQATLERETDLHEMDGEPRPHMTPRRVKRRSYRNSARNSKSLTRERTRTSGKSARSSARSHKSINPVTRLIDADQNRADSSTSGEAERYGQINPGFQADQSRPNSIYNLSGPPTDLEAGASASRPQSALTSYSNFHPAQQRRPAGQAGSLPPVRSALPPGVTNLTQESLMNVSRPGGGLACAPISQFHPTQPLTVILQHETQQQQEGLNASYDDLPPPPPPLASSPAPDCAAASDSDNTSSVATAQMPVPQQRSSIRRSEYVNMPVGPGGGREMQGRQEPAPQQAGPAKPRLAEPAEQAAPPVPPHNLHNYANLPGGPQPSYGGARPRTTNPLYGRKPEPEQQVVPEYESRLTYEAETLRADTKLTMPGNYYNQPDSSLYSLSDNPSQRSSHSEAPLPPMQQRAAHPPPQPDSRYAQIEEFTHQQGERFYPGQDADSGLHSLGPDPPGPPGPPEPVQMKRVPNGHQARDRASLRLKQRREMEARATKQNKTGPPLQNGQNGQAGQAGQAGHAGHADHHGYVNTASHQRGEDDYGFSQQKPPVLNGKPTNGYADMSGKKTPDIDDKWYMKDSMRPVGASNHGQACKCYRCQRKLTAI